MKKSFLIEWIWFQPISGCNIASAKNIFGSIYRNINSWCYNEIRRRKSHRFDCNRYERPFWIKKDVTWKCSVSSTNLFTLSCASNKDFRLECHSNYQSRPRFLNYSTGDLTPKKINVNCICPGAIKTGMTKVMEDNEMMLKQILMSIPAGLMGDPIDIANAALYLASDESDYVTGSLIVVDGGWSVR